MDARKKTAERIKAARSMAGFAERKAFCLKFNLPLATLEAWERGKNPLTLKGAKRIAEALKSVNIYCSEAWLIEGKGFSPRTLDEISVELDLSAPHTLSSIEDNLRIAKEISTFKTLNEGAIVTIVSDNGLSPFFEKGDYVGGVKYTGAFLDKGLGKRCIVELIGGSMIVRLLIKGAHGTYTLQRTNSTLKTPPQAEENIVILSVAPIIWHRSFLQ